MEKMASLSDEYIHLPRTPADLFEVMKHYEEVGLPGAVGSLMLCTYVGLAVLPVILIGPRVRSPIHRLHFSAFLILTVKYLECLVRSLVVKMTSTS